MNEIGLGKNRGVNSAVHIASAISSYARMIINDDKNIPDNPCIMSDTESVVLLNKLDESLIGTELGQMKLEYEIVHGIFIRKKLYAIKTKDNNIIIKSSGINSKSLLFDDFIDMLNGKEVETFRVSFVPDWQNLNIKITNNKIKLKGLENLAIKYIDERLTPNLVLTNTNSCSIGEMSTQISHPKRYAIISASTKYYPVINYTPKIYFIITYKGKYRCIVFYTNSYPVIRDKIKIYYIIKYKGKNRNIYLYKLIKILI